MVLVVVHTLNQIGSINILIEYTVKDYGNGSKEWYLNDQRHREDGPAIERANGRKSWYLNGVELTEQEFNNRTQVQELTIQELEQKLGYKIKIKGES